MKLYDVKYALNTHLMKNVYYLQNVDHCQSRHQMNKWNENSFNTYNSTFYCISSKWYCNKIIKHFTPLKNLNQFVSLNFVK